MAYGDPHEFIYMPRSAESYHIEQIRKAQDRGEIILPEVLAEYPELNPPELTHKPASEIDDTIKEFKKSLGKKFVEGKEQRGFLETAQKSEEAYDAVKQMVGNITPQDYDVAKMDVAR